MKVDNPLSREFLLNYPAEAARVLEQVSVKHVAALFSELPSETGAPVLASMLPDKSAACLAAMTVLLATRLLTELPESSAARIYRLLIPSKQEELSAQLSNKIRSRIRHYLDYPPTSAGALLDPTVDMLPDNVTVAEAIRHIEHLGRSISCDIYLIDEAHQLVGMINLGRLMTSNHQARLREIMIRKTQPLSAHATLETLLSHPGWSSRRRLPVVERDNTLVGVLDYTFLQKVAGETGVVVMRDPLENLLSLASLYWLSVAQLLNSVLGIAGRDKGEKP